ncbi:MAG: polysaccharide deacetylase family protein [Gemmatimonadaceae bacterium]
MRAILTYHSIDASGSAISIGRDAFRAHVRWLASGAVRVVPVAELLRLSPAMHALSLTFDDGFANFADEVAPALLEHGLPATLFVVADHAGKTNAWGGVDHPRVPTLPLLGWAALAALAERGVALGAHSRTHPRLSERRGAALEDEVAGGAAKIRRETGYDPVGFAYPYGDVDAESAAAVARAFPWGCTTELRPLSDRETAERLPRLDAYYLQSPGRLESFGSPSFRGRMWIHARARHVRARLPLRSLRA